MPFQLAFGRVRVLKQENIFLFSQCRLSLPLLLELYSEEHSAPRNQRQSGLCCQYSGHGHTWLSKFKFKLTTVKNRDPVPLVSLAVARGPRAGGTHRRTCRRGKHDWAALFQNLPLGCLYAAFKKGTEFQGFRSGPSDDL